MNPDDLARILDELGQRLGPTGEYVFALAVRQVYIDSVLSVLTGVGLTVAATIVLRAIKGKVAADWARWNALPQQEQRYPYLNNKPDILGGSLWWFVVPGLMFALGPLLITNGLSRFPNPEYAALRDILGAIGGSR